MELDEQPAEPVSKRLMLIQNGKNVRLADLKAIHMKKFLEVFGNQKCCTGVS